MEFCKYILDVILVTTRDIVFVDLVSATVLFHGNIILAAILDWASLMIVSQRSYRRLNLVIGAVRFIAAGLVLIM